MSTRLADTTIETARLHLRPLTSEDAASLLQIFSDPVVMKYWNTAPWTCMADAHAFIEEAHTAMRDETSLVLAIEAKASGALLGKCMLFNYVPTSRRAEIGFGLGREHWGQGYIAEAGQALIEHGFEALGLRRIEAEIDPDNTGSAKSLERLGFMQEGLLRQRWEINGVISDSALYGLLCSSQKAATA